MPYTTQTSEFWGWYLRHHNRAIWKHLSDAGIDVFASGPSNNPEAFLDLTNILPSMTGGFNRRWGMSWLGAGQSVTSAFQIVRTYSYDAPVDMSDPSNTAITDLWLGTDNQNWRVWLAGTNTTFGGFGPTAFANPGNVGAVTSRQFFYYGNGIDPVRKVQPNYTTANTDSLCGIAVPYNAILNPGITDFTGYPNVVGVTANTGLGYTAPPAVTVFDVPGGSGSGATVTVTIDSLGRIDGWSWTGGAAYTNAYATVAAPPSGGTQAYLTLYTQTNPNAPLFGEVVGIDPAGPMSFVQGRRYGVALQNSVTGHTSDVAMAIANGNALTANASTPISGTDFDALTKIYDTQQPFTTSDTYPVYTASVNASGESITAGFTQLSLQIRIPDSLDPQVDTVVLLATSDGGSVGTLYQVALIPLSSFGHDTVFGYYYLGEGSVAPFYDTLPDSFNNSSNIFNAQDTLLASDLWANTDDSGDTFGILLNTPPTAAGFLYPTIHLGRMFATDGKSVFFSKSLDEVTTSTGLITSKWEECWPGDYQLPVALNNETILGLKSDGTNLHIGTDKSIFTLYGSDPSNFDIPSEAFSQTGILSNDCWSVVFAEGIPSGFVWITQDLKVIHSDFSTYRDIGTSIYPAIQNLDQGQLAANKVLSLTQGPYNLVVLQLFLAESSNVQPEYWIWESRLQKWYHWLLPSNPNFQMSSSFVYQYPSYATLPFGVTGGQKFLFMWSNIAGSSFPNRLLQVFYFNPLAFQDQVQSAIFFNIPWSVRTSWQDFGDSTSIKVMNEVEFTSQETLPLVVSLYGATSEAQFETGGVLLKTGNSVTGPINALHVNKFYCAGAPTAAKYYSIAFAPSTAGTQQSVLSSFAAEFYPMARI